MQADELRDLARRAANVTGYRAILVLGSQAVHGALPDADLPSITTMSEEADLAVVNDLSGDTPHQIEAHFGMGSPYHQHFGVYADGISLTEVSLPMGWEGRVRTERIDTNDSDDDNPVSLLFPEIHDLCASKLTVAVTGGFGRRTDREFVSALIGGPGRHRPAHRTHRSTPQQRRHPGQTRSAQHRPTPSPRHLSRVDDTTRALRTGSKRPMGRSDIP